MALEYLTKQGYAIVNDAVEDITKGSPLENAISLDTTDLVSIGKALEEYNLLDGFYGALTNRIAKTIVYVFNHTANPRNVLSDAISFGAFVQKIYIDGLDAVETPSYTINSESETHVDPYGVTATHKITTKIFGAAETWSYEFKTVQNQIKTAFLNDSEMIAFIDGEFQCAYTTMELQKESVVNTAINSGIALCLMNGLNKNVLAEYNAKFGEDLTSDDMWYDSGFIKWANKEMNKFIRLMGRPSRHFNAAQYLNASKRDNLVLEVLSDWSESSKVYLESNVYHDAKVELSGNYSDIDFWQNNNPDDTIALSSITIENKDIAYDEVAEENIVIGQGGIIAFARDKEFTKAMFEEDYSWSIPNVRERSSLYGYDFKRGYAIEPHANSFVFIATDVRAVGDTSVNSCSLSKYGIGQETIVNYALANGKAINKITVSYDDGTPIELTAVDGVYSFTIAPHYKSCVVAITTKNA